MATRQIPVHVKGQTTCIHHKGKQLDFHCEQCQEPICTKCLSSIHKSHPLCDLSEVTPQKTQYIKNFIERTEKHDLVHIGTCIASTDTLLKDNDETFEKLSSQLREQTEDLKEDLDMLTAHTLSLYQKMREDNTKLIQKYKQDLKMYDNQVKQLLQDCKEVLQRGSHIQIYNTSCEVSSTSLPVKPSLGTASFTPNKSPNGHLELALGEVTISGQGQTTTSGQDLTTRDKNLSVPTPDNQPSQQRAMRLKPETNVVSKFYSRCEIYSSCYARDDKMWTANLTDTLTLLDMNGKVLQEVQNKTSIRDISVSPKSRGLWVCDAHNTIMKLVSGQLTRRFTIKQIPDCICFTSTNHIIVGTDNRISKYTTQGQVVLSSGVTETGEPLVYSPHRITECPVTQNIAVADYSHKHHGGDGNKQVVVMDRDFQKLFTYTGEIPGKHKQQSVDYPFHPICVMYDFEGNLVIGDFANRRVLLLDQNVLLRIIHTETKNKPMALCMDGRGLLCVAFDRKVKLLQYSSV